MFERRNRMKRIIKVISAAVISTAFIGSVASAQTCDASINGTGTGSNNTVTCFEVNNQTITCTNNIVSAITNSQTSESGDADSSDNTTGGSASSGNAGNSNQSNITIGSSCESLASTGNTPEPQLPGMGGAGGGAGSAGGELPNTASAITAPLALGALMISAVTIIVSRIALAAYRRSGK